MANTYIRCRFAITPVAPWSEILLAALSDFPFESFELTPTGLDAFIPENQWENHFLEPMSVLKKQDVSLTYTVKTIPPENWNRLWEENFEPVIVDDRCVVRADFHEKANVPYELVITPKMSFGTGHHETTIMMLRYLLDETVYSKTVLDMGTGTGVLAILAEKKGASHVDAVDIDPWCVENAKENSVKNNCIEIHTVQGDNPVHLKNTYDIIMANINKKILMNQINIYAAKLNRGGHLLLSGFYTSDLAELSAQCATFGLKFVSNKSKNDWIAAKFLKQ